MSVVRRIAKNTAALIAANIIVSILSIALSIVIARKLGDVVFGKFSFALAFTSLFTIFADLGYNTLYVRVVARDKTQANKYLSNVLGIRFVLSLTVFIIMIITVNLLQYPDDTKIAVYFFGVYTIFTYLGAVFKLTFRAFEKMEYEAGINIFTSIIRISLGISVILLGYGIMELAFVFLISGSIDVLLSLSFCEKKFVKSTLIFNYTFLKDTIKIAIPLCMLSIFAVIYVRIDTVMLSIMKGDAVVGWYNASYYLIQGFGPISHLFMTALFPVMAHYYIKSKNLLLMTYEKSYSYLFILGLPIATGISLLADKFIILFYGPTFVNSIIALQILSWDVPLAFLYCCSAFLLVSIDKQKQMAIISGSTALVNIILNLILIPPYSYIGSSIATIAAESYLVIMYIYLGSRYEYKLPIKKIFIKPILACIVMGIFLVVFHNYNIMLLIIIAIFIYFVILFLIKGISKEDISLFKKIIKKT